VVGVVIIGVEELGSISPSSVENKKKQKKQKKVVVTLSDKPELKIAGKRRKKEDVLAAFGDESSESEGEMES
jgi:hypothetical protein